MCNLHKIETSIDSFVSLLEILDFILCFWEFIAHLLPHWERFFLFYLFCKKYGLTIEWIERYKSRVSASIEILMKYAMKNSRNVQRDVYIMFLIFPANKIVFLLSSSLDHSTVAEVWLPWMIFPNYSSATHPRIFNICISCLILVLVFPRSYAVEGHWCRYSISVWFSGFPFIQKAASIQIISGR